MSQTQNIVYDFDVREVIEMAGLNPPSINQTVILKMLLDQSVMNVIDHLLERKFNSLSGGEQRMVHFARTLLQSNGLQKNLQKYIFFLTNLQQI